jgi:hypothetical protein
LRTARKLRYRPRSQGPKSPSPDSAQTGRTPLRHIQTNVCAEPGDLTPPKPGGLH